MYLIPYLIPYLIKKKKKALTCHATKTGFGWQTETSLLSGSHLLSAAAVFSQDEWENQRLWQSHVFSGQLRTLPSSGYCVVESEHGSVWILWSNGGFCLWHTCSPLQNSSQLNSDIYLRGTSLRGAQQAGRTWQLFTLQGAGKQDREGRAGQWHGAVLGRLGVQHWVQLYYCSIRGKE